MRDNMSAWLIEYMHGDQSKQEIQETDAFYRGLMEDVEGLCTGK